jgi:hypothetical protein
MKHPSPPTQFSGTMKKPDQILTLVATLLLAPVISTFAQSTWETVDAATPAAGRDIVADSAGNFISLALDYTTTSAVTAVSRSGDGGTTWQTVGSIGGYALDLTAAPDGALFAAGNRSTAVSGKAFVWQSLDHGATWTTSDPWAGQSKPLISYDIAAGNSTAVYVCGSSNGRWIVRKGLRSGSGIAWTTVDNIAGVMATAICVRPASPGEQDEVIVFGSVAGLWTVRRSVNGGASWATVDSYSIGLSAGYAGVTAGPGNSIYVVGRIAKKVGSSTQYGWLVRKTADGGATWADMDYVANGLPGGNITVDAFGRVLVAGFNLISPYSSLVRGSTDGGVTWTTTDSYRPTGATSSQAWGIASDAAGNVCVSGETIVANVKTATIRRLAAP